MSTKYQFIVFIDSSDYDDIENQIKEKFGFGKYECPLGFKDCNDYAIELLSQWDYGEYTENELTYEEFLNEIGNSAHIYDNNSGYILITYGLLPSISLYRKIENNL